MANQPVVNPQEFGLEAEQATKIESAFTPMVIEREALSKVYETIINSEISPELCKEAGECRKKLVKVRTGIDRIHKAEKQFYLSGGRFVDAWKNKNVVAIDQMEITLEGIENHYKRIEEERLNNLKLEREEKLKEFGTDTSFVDLRLMTEDQFQSFYNANKLQFETKKAEEEKARTEAERQAEVVRLRTERRTELLEKGLLGYSDGTENWGEMTEAEYIAKHAELVAKFNAAKAEEERIKAENEKLRKEAEEAERLIKEAEDRAEAERVKAQKEADEKLAKERAEKEKLEAELRARQKADADAKAKAEAEEKERIAAEKKAAKAPVKEKMKVWVNGFEIAKVDFNSQDANVIATQNLIQEKFNSFKEWAQKQIESI